MSRIDKKSIRVFYCAIDLRAWHKLRAETYPIPEPVDMCNRYCSERIMAWYLQDGVIDENGNTFQYFFDKCEYFKKPFEDKWKAETSRSEKTGIWNPWNLVEQVAAVDMKKVPGVQAADIIAWGVNREITENHSKGRFLAQIIRDSIPYVCTVWDEEAMRSQFKPLLYLR
jgi:hypothetical protein